MRIVDEFVRQLVCKTEQPSRLACDNAESANRLHHSQVQELIAKANQAIREAQWLRQKGGRSLRREAESAGAD